MLTVIEHVRNCENEDCGVCETELREAEEAERAASEEESLRRGLSGKDRTMFEHGAKERRESPLSVVFAEGHPFHAGWRWQDGRLNDRDERERRAVIVEVANLLNLDPVALEARMRESAVSSG